MRNDEEYYVPKEWQNNIDRKPLAFDLVEDFLLFCIFYPAFALMFYEISKSSFDFVRALIILPVLIALTFSRRVTKNIFVNALLLLLILTGAFFVPLPSNEKFLFMGTTIAAAILSANKLKNEIKSKEINYDRDGRAEYNRFLGGYVPAAGFVFIFIIYMISLAFHLTTVITICFFSFVTFLIAYQIYVHARGTCVLKDWEQAEQNNSSRNFTVFFSALLAAGLGIISFVVYKIVYLTGLNRADNGILYFLTHGRKVDSAPVAPIIKSKPSVPKMNLGKVAIKPRDAGALGQILNLIVLVIVAAVALVVLAVLLRWLFNIIRNFQKNSYEETQSVFSLREKKKQVSEKLRSLSGIGGFIQSSSNSVKIRRLYYRTILKFSHSGADILRCDAPFEIGEKVKDRVSGDINAVTELYEKARYAKDECTPEEVKAVKLHIERKKSPQ